MDGFMANVDDSRIAVIGLGYVGLPLACEFGKILPTVGFDINRARIEELQAGRDSTREVEPEGLAAARRLSYAWDEAALADCNVFVITVPTPVGSSNRPVLAPLRKASETVGRALKPGDVVIYESTVYPGCTEEYCVPILERESGFSLNRDFFVGYSPERINPGDKDHRLPSILKVTSGSTPETAAFVDQLYQRIITAGTHQASSVKVAEAAKVIENTQRDLNIALINELACIFHRLGIDTLDVLEAAGTKWNFLPFRPGLVGGHCIGVDPYYLTHKAEEVGHHPEIILAGRRINDGMAAYVAAQLIKLMIGKGIQPAGARVLVLGLTFKENCPDVRNTKVVDLVRELESFSCRVDIFDPWVNKDEATAEYGLTPIEAPAQGVYDALVVAVGHHEFKAMGANGIRALGRNPHVLYDIKYVLPKDAVDARL
jgi:UDP-N-acetyl-D-galactosamine dehydrogenase